MKKFSISLATLLIVVLLSGCSLWQSKAVNKANLQMATSTTPQRQNQMMPDYPEGSSADISVGTKVMAIGLSNADGSIFADRIFIGTTTTDFSILQNGFEKVPNMNNASGTPPNFNRTGEGERQVQDVDTVGERQAPPDFADLSEEEKKLMQERMQNRPAGHDKLSQNASTGAGNVNGEVLNIDDSSLTLKLDSGGTKLVLISEFTKIYLLPAENDVNNSM